MAEERPCGTPLLIAIAWSMRTVSHHVEERGEGLALCDGSFGVDSCNNRRPHVRLAACRHTLGKPAAAMHDASPFLLRS